MELNQIFFMLRRWLWLIAVGLLIGLISGVVVSLVMTPVYEFETKVLVSRNPQSVTAEFPNLNDVQLVQTYVELLSTDQIINLVSANIGYEIDSGKLTIQQLRDTQIIQIAVEDTNTDRGMKIANGLVQVLQEENNRLQAQQFITAESSLEEQIAQAQNEMRVLQQEIDSILTEDVESQLAEVDAQIAVLESEILELQNELARMANPLAIVVQGRQAESEARLDLLQDLLIQYQGIRTNLIFLGRPDETSTGVANPRLEQLNSTLALYEGIYLAHLSSLEDLRLARLQNTPTVTQIEVATIPDDPIRPIPIIYTGLAAIVGAAIAVAGVVVIEFMDDSIKTPEDIRAIQPLPILGMIRKASSIKSHFINDQEINEEPLCSVFEDYRSLGVQLQYQQELHKFTTMMVTSCGNGEGKTTAAINLATIFARSGQPVLLLDANLLQPRLHSILGDSSEIQVLDIVPPGQEHALTANDLLGMRKIVTVLDRIEDWGNRLVIIDGPPIFTADAKILASKVDSVVMVVKAWETQKGVFRAALNQLEQVDAKIRGVVLNAVPTQYSYYYSKYQFLKPEELNNNGKMKFTNGISRLFRLFSARAKEEA